MAISYCKRLLFSIEGLLLFRGDPAGFVVWFNPFSSLCGSKSQRRLFTFCPARLPPLSVAAIIWSSVVWRLHDSSWDYLLVPGWSLHCWRSLFNFLLPEKVHGRPSYRSTFTRYFSRGSRMRSTWGQNGLVTVGKVGYLPVRGGSSHSVAGLKIEWGFLVLGSYISRVSLSKSNLLLVYSSLNYKVNSFVIWTGKLIYMMVHELFTTIFVSESAI